MSEVRVHVFLFPGLACDGRLFQYQISSLTRQGYVVKSPAWIEPEKKETLEDFSLRWAQSVMDTYGDTETCYVGGLSFGGMVAPYIGEYFQEHGWNVQGCFRISTFRSGVEIPWNVRAILRFLYLTFPVSARLIKLNAWIWGKMYPHRISSNQQTVYAQLLDSPNHRLYHVLRMLYQWRSPPREYSFPIWQIHGLYDRLLPVGYTRPDEVIPTGHCMTLTRPEDVTAFFLEKMVESIT